MPIAATRMSECPIKAAMFAPSGNERRRSTYVRASRQVRLCLTTEWTASHGSASTRENMSAQSSASANTVDSEQLPISTVVTPWRTDSERAGAASTSTS